MSDVKAQADKGTSFSVLAEKYSEASSGRNGGEIGYITPRMPIGPQSKPMNQVLENALFSLSPGKTSDIVQTTHGLHILYITDKQTTITPTIDDLITSKVLPNAVKQDLLTSEIRKRIETSLAAHKGKVADAPTTGSALTTETIAFYIDEKPVTIQNLEQVYGIRFTRAYQARQGNPEALADLLKQVLEDEGMIRAAIDAGLGAKPETAKELKTVAERGIAARRLQAIISEVYPVNDERVRAEYEATKSDYLVPEADGLILVVNAEATSDPATAARGREKARAAIMKAQADLKAGSSFDNVVKALKAQNLDTTGGEVARHAIGMSPDLNVRAFDQAISMAQDDGQLSDIVPASNGFAVAKLGKRYKGEPTPYERVRQRLRQMVLSKNTDQARDDMVRQLLKSGKAKIHEDKIKAAPKQDNN